MSLTVVMPIIEQPLVVTLKGGPGSGHRGHTGGRGGKGNPGGSTPTGGVTVGYFAKGRGRRKFRPGSTTKEQREAMVAKMVEAGITENNIENMSFTVKPVGSAVDVYSVGKTHYESAKSKKVTGFYTYGNQTASVHPNHLRANTLIHEIGHHVTNKLGNKQRLELENQARKISKDIGGRTFSAKRRAAKLKYGLRNYSFTKPEEFLADCFVTYKMGTSQQRRNIVKLWEETPWDIEDVFKELDNKVLIMLGDA